MRTLLWYVLLITVSPALLLSDTIHVPGDYAKIQGAIDAAVNGDEVLVAPGTYVESLDFLGKAITVGSEKGSDETFISVHFVTSVVSFINGEGPDSVLQGFTIEGGEGTDLGGGTHLGGGLYCVDSSPTIRNNRVRDNRADYGYGAGIYCYGSSAVIVGNEIIMNDSGIKGGGIYGEASPLAVRDNRIVGNQSNDGGGIALLNCQGAAIVDNIMMENEAWFYGGGLFIKDSRDVVVANNLIARNKAIYILPYVDGYGGGAYLRSETTNHNIDFTGNTLVGNSAALGGGLMWSLPDGVVTNTILWDNEALYGPEIDIGHNKMPCPLTVRHSNVKGGMGSVYLSNNGSIQWGAGMIETDPLFADLAADDYHLTYASPCMNAGDNGAPGIQSLDFEGDPRNHDSTVDMGADEFYTHLYITGDTTAGGLVAGKLVGTPGTAPVGLFVGIAALPAPIPTMWGGFWLDLGSPWVLFSPLGTIPSSGVMVLGTTLPGTPPAPYDVPMQALIGLNPDSLTNLYSLEVR